MAEPAPDDDESRASSLDRALRVFGDVRAGEGLTVLLMFATVFVLLVAYYILKTVREPLILVGGGAELKSYAAAVQAATLVLYVPLYGWVASKLPRRKLIPAVVLFFAGCVELFFLGQRAGVPQVGFVFYVWVGIFSLTTIAQFWSFANDIYERGDGDRLFPLIGVGSTLGAWAGAFVAEWLFEAGLHPELLMQVAALLLLLHLFLYVAVQRRGLGRANQPPGALKRGGGFGLVLGSPYLRLVAVLIVLLNVVNTLGEYILGRSVVAMADARLLAEPGFDKSAYIGAFYGQYFFWVNVLTNVIQAFVASRLVAALGFAGALLALPLVAFGSYGIVAAGAGFAALRLAKIAENATDYSLMNTARQMLWLPTSREEKYNAKQAIDTFFMRAGDMLAAGLVFLGTHQLALGVRGFAGANLGVIALWLGVAALLLRQYRRLAAPAGPA